MRFIVFLLITLFINSGLTFSQVGINADGSAPDNSAGLEVKFPDKGFLLPRLTVYQQKTIENPATGLLVFNLDSLDIYVYTGNYWLSVLKCDIKDTIYPWTCGDSVPVSHVTGNVAPVTKSVTYGTVTNIPGETTKCWITSNLGADHQATAVNDATEASAGWYWQFNRQQGYKHDGSTRTPSTTWITSIIENLDWEVSNDPCMLEMGEEWRIPSRSEWLNVDAAGSWDDWNDPWNSALKLHAGGYLVSGNGNLVYQGEQGVYWSNLKYSNEKGYHLYFSLNNCDESANKKSWGYTIRCISD